MPPKGGAKRGAKKKEEVKVYSEEEVTALCEKFLKCKKRYKDNLGAKVKRNAAERDLLKAAEQARDMMYACLQGDKHHLEIVLGGTCRNFHILDRARDEVEFSKENANDPRWDEMAKQAKNVEEILKQLGSFRKWVDTTPPTGLNFGPEIPEWIGCEEEMEFGATIEGTDPETMFYRVVPALPEGLVLNKLTGNITGATVEDLEMKPETFTIIAGNVQGDYRKEVKFGVRPAPPLHIAYDTEKPVAVGVETFIKPHITGGKPHKWKIDKELPRGLMLDKRYGTILGSALKRSDNQEYLVTGSNLAGTITTTFQLTVLAAPPTSINYPHVQNCDLTVGVSIYCLPEIELKLPDGSVKKTRSVISMGDTEVAKAVRKHQPEAAWGRQDAESNTYQGKRWSKVRNPNWEGLMQKGMDADIEFTVEPELPAGLYLSKNTGVLFGKPKANSERREYLVKAKNDAGGCETRVIFGVVMLEPKGLAYPDAQYLFFEATPVNLYAEVDGWVEKWSIEPALPNGLHLDDSDGTISGVPFGAAPEGAYKVTASNEVGETSVLLKFQIQQGIPKMITYDPNVTEHCVLMDIQLIPQCSAESGQPVMVRDYTIEPPLPESLKMDPATGVITGQPQKVQPLTSYTIKCRNEMGSTETTMAFEVLDMPPQDLKYPGIDDHYGTGEEMKAVPQIRGAAKTWSIEPELPTGLKFDETKGIISGIPEALSAETVYTVTCSNPLGGTTAEITFEVVAGKPEELLYPELGTALKVGQGMRFDPVVVPFAAGASFEMKTPLPEGLELDAASGVISGAPVKAMDKQKFQLTATNSCGSVSAEIEFECFMPNDDPLVVDQVFAAKIEDCIDLEDMPEEPDKKKRLADWMIWMVHRAWLNDPKLTIFDFSNMHMLLPKEEPRIQPKLARAIKSNTYIVTLLLSSTNFRNATANSLAKSLKKNTTIEVLNLESNWLDPEGVKAIAEALTENTNASIHTWRIANQIKGDNFGRPVEEALHEMLDKNENITKLGFSAQDAHWKNQIDKKLLRNADAARRKRKADKGIPDKVEELPATKKSLVKLIFEGEPEKAVWELFEDDDENFLLMRRFMSQRRIMPSREQLQNFAKAQNVNVTYAQVAPLMIKFRKTLLDSMVGVSITCEDEQGNAYTGTLKKWKEKNDRMKLEMQGEALFDFTSAKLTPLSMSDDFADWLSPSDE